MSDEEIICAWMEPRPGEPSYRSDRSPGGWWQKVINYKPDIPYAFKPRELDLDALYEVQSRLTDEQWEEYDDEILPTLPRDLFELEIRKAYIHASPKQKITALASVLRPEVEKAP